MRRRLALSAVAVTTMVVVAFVIPLAFVVKVLASSRATDRAQLEAQVLADALATVSDRGTLARLVNQANAGGARPTTVFLPDGQVLGSPAPAGSNLQLARQGRAFTATSGSGRAVYIPVRTEDGSTSVVRVFVPGAQLTRGVARAWGILGLLGVTLIGLSVLLADRLARSLVRPMSDLAAFTHQLERGDLGARIKPTGPAEVASIGHAVNLLAGRIGELVAAEREAAADVSHRLRTPLTALRLDAEGLADPMEKLRLSADVDALEHAISQVIHEARQPPRPGDQGRCDLVATTRTRAAFWSALARIQRRPCSVDLPRTDTLDVATSASDLAAALDALVANVFAHTPEGTGFRISVSGSDDGGVLVVEDDGPGFPPGDVLSRGRSTAGSTGLGLDIARAVAERSSGRILVGKSATGGGRVELALTRNRAQDPPGDPDSATWRTGLPPEQEPLTAER
jgi:signal transduction histidine kinase